LGTAPSTWCSHHLPWRWPRKRQYAPRQPFSGQAEKEKDAGLARPGLMGPRKLIVKGSLAGLLGQGSSAWQKAPSWHYSRLFAQLCRPNLAPAVMPAAVGAARASATRMLFRTGFRFRTTRQTTGGREMTLWSIQRVWPAERKLACTKQASSSSLLSC